MATSNVLDSCKILGRWWRSLEASDSIHGKSSHRWRHVHLLVLSQFVLTSLCLLKSTPGPSRKEWIPLPRNQKDLGTKKYKWSEGVNTSIHVGCRTLCTKFAGGKKKVTWFWSWTCTCLPCWAITSRFLVNRSSIWSCFSSYWPGPISKCLAIANLYKAASITDCR